MGSRKNSFPPIDSVHWDGESLTSEKNAVDSQRSFFFPSLADTCCPMARLGKKRSIPEIQRIILPSVRMESSCRRRHSPAQRESPPKNPTSPASRARRRSPHSGSAAAGAHIAREAGRCAPTAPRGERQPRYTTCDSDARRHTDKGSTGVVGGVEGFPLSPPAPRREATTPRCRAKATIQCQKRKEDAAGRRRPGTGQKPPASGEKNKRSRRPRPNAGQQPSNRRNMSLPCRFAA